MWENSVGKSVGKTYWKTALQDKVTAFDQDCHASVLTAFKVDACKVV